MKWLLTWLFGVPLALLVLGWVFSVKTSDLLHAPASGHIARQGTAVLTIN